MTRRAAPDSSRGPARARPLPATVFAAVVAALLALAVTAPVPPASAVAAAQEPGGPALELEPGTARPGEAIIARLSGWKSVAATVTVCGNLARRGSADCDLGRGQGVPLAPTGGDASVKLVVAAPPVPCPCVVRAASGSHDEVATAPLTIIGAPEAPVVEPSTEGPLVSVSVDARGAPEGLVGAARAALGGRTRYEVAVSVRNLTDSPLREVRLSGTATRSGHTVASFAAEARPLDPDETYTYRREVDIPAPTIGALRWEAAASGAGPPAHSDHTTRTTPVALLALVALFVGDLAAIALRFRVRRRQARSTAADAEGDEDALPDGIVAVG